jgi:hypothetical protein
MAYLNPLGFAYFIRPMCRSGNALRGRELVEEMIGK